MKGVQELCLSLNPRAKKRVDNKTEHRVPKPRLPLDLMLRILVKGYWCWYTGDWIHSSKPPAYSELTEIPHEQFQFEKTLTKFES